MVSFSGICRGSESGEPIAALTLEHYPGMAEAEIGRHAEEAMARWPLTGLTVIHRVGRITPGENIVLVVTASAHRQAAFEAAEFLMDYLKANAPFWKSEESAKGNELDRGPRSRRRGGRALDQILMAKSKQGREAIGQTRPRPDRKPPKVAPGELLTLLDFVRYAVSRFIEADLMFAHGTTDPVAEAAFLVCETLHLHPDQFESFATARVTVGGRQADPRRHRSPRRHAQTGRLSRQQDLHARPAVLCRRTHHRAALLHRRIAGLAFRRQR